MKVNDGCVDSLQSLLLEVSFTTGTVSVVKNKIAMTVYPNPTSNALNVQMEGSDIFIKHINLYNILGQRVATKTISLPNATTESINVNHLPAGTYIIMVETNMGPAQRKFEVIK